MNLTNIDAFVLEPGYKAPKWFHDAVAAGEVHGTPEHGLVIRRWLRRHYQFVPAYRGDLIVRCFNGQIYPFRLD